MIKLVDANLAWKFYCMHEYERASAIYCGVSMFSNDDWFHVKLDYVFEVITWVSSPYLRQKSTNRSTSLRSQRRFDSEIILKSWKLDRKRKPLAAWFDFDLCFSICLNWCSCLMWFFASLYLSMLFVFVCLCVMLWIWNRSNRTHLQP